MTKLIARRLLRGISQLSSVAFLAAATRQVGRYASTRFSLPYLTRMMAVRCTVIPSGLK